MAVSKQKRCEEGYGVKSLRIMKACKAKGMHLLENGKVFLKSGKIHNGTPQYGRDRITMFDNGEVICVQVARVVCFLAWGDPPTANSVVDHIDGNTLNDAPNNLRWSTYSDNLCNNKFTRNKTREQMCIEAMEGVSNPAAVKQLCAVVNQILKALDNDEPVLPNTGLHHNLDDAFDALDTPVLKTEEEIS